MVFRILHPNLTSTLWDDSLGISSARRDEAHHSYLASIIAAAKRDGVITESEHRLINQIMDALDITDVVMPDVTKLQATGNLCKGMRVCFTGEAIVDGESIARHVLEKRGRVDQGRC